MGVFEGSQWSEEDKKLFKEQQKRDLERRIVALDIVSELIQARCVAVEERRSLDVRGLMLRVEGILAGYKETVRQELILEAHQGIRDFKARFAGDRGMHFPDEISLNDQLR